MSLVEITKDIRLLTKIAAGVTILGIVIFLFIQGGTIIKNVFYPTPKAPPEEKFGKLPSLNFSENTKQLEYRINTVSGNLPTFPDRIQVFTVFAPSANILALQDVRRKMINAGYTDQEQKVPNKDTFYQWSNPNLGSTIVYDLLSNDFLLQSNYLTTPDLILDNSFPDNDSLIQTVKEFLGQLQEDISDVDPSKTTVKLYTIEGQNLSELTNPNAFSSARAAKVQLNQANLKVNPFTFGDGTINSLPIVYENPLSSNIVFTVISTKYGLQTVEGQYYHFLVNQADSSTYPIKTAQQAFDDLTKGNALVNYTGTSASIDITDVNIAYFMPKNRPSYIEPVFVFSGKDFTAYVQAIPNSSLEN